MPGANDPRDFPHHMLERAEQLYAQGFHGAALVAAQSACEVACELTVERWLELRGGDYLHGCIHHLWNSFSISNDRTRELYSALTRDHIERQAFWQDYKVFVKRRNDVVHAGAQVDADTARRLLNAARAVAGHLEAVRQASVDAVPADDRASAASPIRLAAFPVIADAPADELSI